MYESHSWCHRSKIFKDLVSKQQISFFYSQLDGHNSQFGNPMASSFKQFSFLGKSLGDLVFNRQQTSVEEPAYTSTARPIHEERG